MNIERREVGGDYNPITRDYNRVSPRNDPDQDFYIESWEEELRGE